MDFFVEDYSDAYYGAVLKAPVPRQRGGRFIQVRTEGAEYIVLSPAQLSSHHANILERFCRMHGIEGEYTSRKMDEFEIYDADWTVAGGGRWYVDECAGLLSLFGTSGTYGKFDARGLKERFRSAGFYGFDVKIDG